MQCFVCSVQLDGDPSFVQHHLNSCLDRQGSSCPAPSTAPLPRLDTASSMNPSAPSRLFSPSIPAPLSSNSEQFRLDATLALALAYEEQGQSAGLSSSRAKSPVFSVATTADESLHCPCCAARWCDLGIAAPSAGEEPEADGKRRKHVQKCLGGREKLIEETGATGVGLHGEWENNGGGRYDEGRVQIGGLGRPGGVGGKGEVRGTAGLLPLIRTALIRSNAASHGRTQIAYLASDGVEHIATKFIDWGWGCGYKNAQMLFSALRHLPCYAELFAVSSAAVSSISLSVGSTNSGAGQKTLAPIPTIREWQELIEKAWSAGHDPPGRAHFNGKLIGSRRWIGTTEVYTALTWMGVKATIIDFPKVEGGQGTHQALVRWIIDYFATTTTTAPSPTIASSASTRKNAFSLLTFSGSPVRTSTPHKQPLYLQHAGHSRTVIGVEVMKGAEAGGGGKGTEKGGGGDMWLLVFDPGKPIPQDLKRAAASLSSASALEHDVPSSLAEHSPLKKLKSTLSSSSSSTKPGGFGRRGGKKEEEIKFSEVLKVVRVNMKDLKKRDEYQILCVEETAPPLTSEEKAARKLVKAKVAMPVAASFTPASGGSTPRVA
ncbi:hypothetical protein JCM1841_000997 [Sporobolomyces salmonicolor]